MFCNWGALWLIPLLLHTTLLASAQKPQHPNHCQDAGYVNCWDVTPVSSKQPVPRAFAASSLLPANLTSDPYATEGIRVVLMFGGWEPTTAFTFDESWLYFSYFESFAFCKNTTVSPPARIGATMNPSGIISSVYLFGGVGSSNQFFNDLWQAMVTPSLLGMSLISWTQITNISGSLPPPRAFHSSSLITTTQDMLVIFGGVNSASDVAPFDDLWILRVTDLMWQQILQSPNAWPVARQLSCFVFSNITNMIYMYGGLGANGAMLSDFWGLDGVGLSTWTPLNTSASSPGPLYGHNCVTYNNSIAILNGVSVELSDLDYTIYMYAPLNKSWDEMSIKTDVEPRVGACVNTFSFNLPFGGSTFESAGVVIQGLSLQSGLTIGNSYAFSSLSVQPWIELSYEAPVTPPSRMLSPICTSTGGEFAVMYGGLAKCLGTFEVLQDAYFYDYVVGIWIEIPTFKDYFSAGPKYAHTLSYSNSQSILIGGCDIYNSSLSLCRPSHHVWISNFLYWHNVTFIQIAGHSANPFDDNSLILFGGHNATTIQNTLWSVNLTSLLAQDGSRFFSSVLVSGSSPIPSPRAYHSATTFFASATNTYTLYIFGGLAANGSLLNDLWMFNMAQSWTQLPSTPNAVPNAFAAIVTFPVLFVIIGGLQSGLPTNAPVFSDNSLSFDIVTQTWTYLDTHGLFPSLAGVSSLTSDITFSLYPSAEVFGGSNPFTGSVSASFAIRFGCNAGSFSVSFGNISCQLCPQGSYSATAGSTSCVLCDGEGVTTNVTAGATSVDFCNSCAHGQCSGHGHCTVIAGVATCDCESAYSGKTCNFSLIAVAVPSLTAILIIIALVMWRWRRRYHKYKYGQQYYQKLLQKSEQEVQELNRAFHIDMSELHMVKIIGSGGFADVWLGDYGDLTVAIKVLKESVMDAEGNSINDFQQEIRQLRTYRHPNIVFFLGAGSMHGMPFLVTEYMSRGSLHKILKDETNKLDFEMEVRLALDAAKGMRFLHGLNPVRVHRDLKSSNLLVNDRWIVKVADFGTAKISEMTTASKGKRTLSLDSVSPQGDYRMLSQGVGTLLWQAPEVIRNVNHQYLPASDVYSFGIIMWEILSRRLPFEHYGSQFDVESAILRGERPALQPNWNQEYVLLMRACWNHDAAARPTFQEVVERLDRLGEQSSTNDVHQR